MSFRMACLFGNAEIDRMASGTLIVRKQRNESTRNHRTSTDPPCADPPVSDAEAIFESAAILK